MCIISTAFFAAFKMDKPWFSIIQVDSLKDEYCSSWFIKYSSLFFSPLFPSSFSLLSCICYKLSSHFCHFQGKRGIFNSPSHFLLFPWILTSQIFLWVALSPFLQTEISSNNLFPPFSCAKPLSAPSALRGPWSDLCLTQQHHFIGLFQNSSFPNSSKWF